MAYQYINCTLADGVATITLDRPDVLNSFNAVMALELQLCLGAIARDPLVRAVLLTGNGRAFCAGQDLAEAVPAEGPAPDLGDIVRDSYNPIVRVLREMEKPVICAVNGVAAGAGANLALACDILIAAEEASFIQSFSKIGLIPDTGGTFFLPRLVGLHRATAMMFLGEKVGAAKAKELGMVHEVVPSSVLRDTALAMARSLAQQATRGLGLTKRALNHSLSATLDAQLDYEEQVQREAGSTHDYQEGVRAFLEKRKPEYTGS
ncbi:MAG TPA: enoyl-CoA hydratase-related protein [Gemmatimonadaceae bacterium]|jgi:2-(1,2-epoxy-1,2-dihydrophenyl)acetyl-CoA isomerase|nr:enoyl-CoA hydratase-related protein [Gemmatimonadaceae bacterium]